MNFDLSITSGNVDYQIEAEAALIGLSDTSTLVLQGQTVQATQVSVGGIDGMSGTLVLFYMCFSCVTLLLLFTSCHRKLNQALI